MTRNKIEDLPKDIEISREEMRKVLGGMNRALPSQLGIRVQLQQSRQKTTTGKSFSDIASSGLNKSADAALSAGALAAPFIPGGSVVSTAMSGVGQLKDSRGG